MKILPLLTISSLFLLGCSSTTEQYQSNQTTNAPLYQYKICLKEGDSVSENMIAEALKAALYSNSDFSPVRRVDGTSDVHIYKGLNLNIQNGTFKAVYLHRHSTEMDRTKNVNIDSYFEALASYQIFKESQCSVFKFSSPFSYDIKTRRTIILTEVEQLNTPEKLEHDLLSSLENAQPRIEITKSFSHSSTKDFSNLAPRDIATTLQIKHEIDAKKTEDKYIATTNLNLTNGYTAMLNLEVLPFKQGSVVQYSANVTYKNEYKGDGSSRVLSRKDFEEFSALIDKFIFGMNES